MSAARLCILVGLVGTVLPAQAVGPAFTVVSDGIAPRSAQDPVHGTWLVVWSDRGNAVGNPVNAIFARLYDEGGSPLTGVITVDAAGYNHDPDVAYVDAHGGRFLVVWARSTNPPLADYDHVRGRLVRSADGVLSGAAQDITSPSSFTNTTSPSASGGPGTMLVAWAESQSGSPDPHAIFVDKLIPLAGGGFQHTSSLTVLRNVVNTGSKVARPRLTQSGFRRTTAPALGPWFHYQVVWQRWWPTPAPGDWDVETAVIRVSTLISNVVIVSPGAALPAASAIGVDESMPAIGVSALDTTDTAERVLLAWEQAGSIRGQVHTLSGPQAPAVVIQPSGGTGYAAPAVGAGACELTVAYRTAAGSDVYGARVRRDGTLAANSRPIASGGTKIYVGASSRPLLGPGAAAPRNTSLVTWSFPGTILGGGSVEARFYEPVSAQPSFFGVGCTGPGALVPAIGTTGGAPHPGNAAFTVTLSQGQPSSPAVLVLGTVLANSPIAGAPGCIAYIGPPYAFIPTATDATGTAAVPIPVPCSPAFQGAYVGCQWAVPTPGHNAAGLVVSDVLDIYWVH